PLTFIRGLYHRQSPEISTDGTEMTLTSHRALSEHKTLSISWSHYQLTAENIAFHFRLIHDRDMARLGGKGFN
ncbi:hypothetical protein, partial [Klebsiella pneumoniae]